jgi:hypothetical protein
MGNADHWSAWLPCDVPALAAEPDQRSHDARYYAGSQLGRIVVQRCAVHLRGTEERLT